MGLKKFFTKHADELGKIAGVLGAIIGALPIDRQDKRNLGGAVESLAEAAGNIANSAEKMKDFDVSLDKAAIKEALAEILPDMLAGIVEKQLRKSASKPKKTATPPASN
jgi:hypothetical protein